MLWRRLCAGYWSNYPMAEIVLDAVQQQAVRLIESAPIGVVTGGPGRGKTTILKEALTHLTSYELASPTGKAARRMSEATGRPARTIHRLLGWTPQGFTHGSGLDQTPLDTDVVLVDESSMLDIRLGSALMSALGNRTRIVFVGDADQLPPVGPGAVFRDLIASAKVPVVRLEVLYRAAAESWVCRNAPKILKGEPLETKDIHDFSWYQIGEDDGEHISDVVLQVLKEQLAGHATLDTIQVLSPMKIRDGGTRELNAKLQPAVNARGVKGPGWKLWDDMTLHVADRVMQTRNDYLLGVFNGEVGTVARIEAHELVVKFDSDVYVTYSREQARALQLAYACTIHKYQGSEVDDVIVVCHSAHHHMLTRQLFYTAITRAKKRVFLVGDAKGLATALRTSRDEQRKTRLVARIQGGVA